MRERPLPKLDLQLVQQFEVLMAERHVSRAARALGLSQPAMSGALSKLRRIFNDRLLTKTPSGMMPTPRALEIAPRMRRILAELDAALAPPTFDPARDKRVFAASVTELVAPLLIPRITALLARCAPGLELAVWPNHPATTRDRLEDGTYDFAIDHRQHVSEGLHGTTASTDTVCVVCSVDSARKSRRRLTLADFAGRRHVKHFGRTGRLSLIERMVDDALARKGLARTTSMRMSSIGYAVSAVESSELLFCMPRKLAEHYAGRYRIAVLDPPLALPPIETVLTWHARSHSDAAHAWMRGEVRRILAGL